MRTTIDIPDEVYRSLKARAALARVPLRDRPRGDAHRQRSERHQPRLLRRDEQTARDDRVGVTPESEPAGCSLLWTLVVGLLTEKADSIVLKQVAGFEGFSHRVDFA